MTQSGLSRVAILATGGTIANTTGGRVGIDSVLDDIAREFPSNDVRQVAVIATHEVIRDGAENFTPVEWQTIAQAVGKCVKDDSVDGVVVSHGTFTAEETAYFLHLVIRTDKPIVVACSQRKHGTMGNDGDRNLLDAVRVASSASARGRGVLVVINEEIHCARDVTKSNQRPSGFTSGNVGLLGSIEADQPTFYRRPERRHTASSEFSLPGEPLPRVDVVSTYAGADGVAVDAFLQAGTQGLVVNGFSFNGKPHRLQLPALERARSRGVPVVLVNRGGAGRVPVESADGFVRGDNLTAQKARVLLALALSATRDSDELQRFFSEY